MSKPLTVLLRVASPIVFACLACSTPSAAPDTVTGPSATTAPVATTPAGSAAAAGPVRLLDDLGGRQLFPPDNWWNQDVSRAPLDSEGDAFINFIGSGRTLHPDFGPPPYGIPYYSVGGAQPRLQIGSFMYGDESDRGAPGDAPGYPIPDEARTMPNYIEGGVPGGGSDGDRHMIIVDRDRWILYETWETRWNASAQRWDAGSGAVFDMTTSGRRPEGWTSADAGGLAILPGLIRYDEFTGSAPIRHALRFTCRSTNGYVWPASHTAGHTGGAPPLGLRLRLKASVNLAGFTPGVQKIFQAMKTYGLVLADNGSDMYITGTMDPRWNNDELNPAFRQLRASDFEVVQRGWR
jgi:hypothetical protein